MRPQRLLIATLSSIWLAAPEAAAIDPIEGAFGIRLGETFIVDGWPVFGHNQIVPPEPGTYFDSFSITSTPITGLVSSIMAGAPRGTRISCLNDIEVLQSILKNRYGPPLIDHLESDVHIGDTYTYGDRFSRSIVISCTKFPEEDIVLFISYHDFSLGTQSGWESKALREREIERGPL
jgi:hypothetical protein